MPNDFMGPPETTEDEQQAFMGPPDPSPQSPLAQAFAQLDAAGVAPEPTSISDVFKDMIPVYGQVRSMRRARRRNASLANVADSATSLLDELIGKGADVEYARSVTFLQTARRLQALGFRAEASQLRNLGLNNLKAHRDTLASREKAKADLDKTVAETENIGDTALVNLQEERAKLEQANEDPNLSDVEREDNARKIGEIEARIDIETTRQIVGRTQFDLLADPTFQRQQMSDHFEDTILLNRIDVAEQMLNAVTADDVSLLARADAAFAGYLQAYFGFEPSLSQLENINNIVNQRGSASLVAAKIRHSLTGAQMSAFEIVYLEPFLPAPGDPLDVQRAKLRLIRKFIASDINTRMQLLYNPQFSAKFMDIEREQNLAQTDELTKSARQALENFERTEE